MISTVQDRDTSKLVKHANGKKYRLVQFERLEDGRFLVYERKEHFGPGRYIARVHLLNPADRTYLPCAWGFYRNTSSDRRTSRILTNALMKFIQ